MNFIIHHLKLLSDVKNVLYHDLKNQNHPKTNKI